MNHVKNKFIAIAVFATIIFPLAGELFPRKINVPVIECSISDYTFFKRIDSIVNYTKLKSLPIIELDFHKYLGNDFFAQYNCTDSVFRTMCESDFNLDTLFAISLFGNVAISPENANRCVVSYNDKSYLLPKECMKWNLITQKNKKVVIFDNDDWIRKIDSVWGIRRSGRYILCSPHFPMRLLPKDCGRNYFFIGTSECEEDSTSHQSKP